VTQGAAARREAAQLAIADVQEPLASRRGSTSLRQRNINAYETMEFPGYPEGAVASSPFDLPRTMIDNEAPLSARKWDLALTLASTVQQQREQAMQKQLAAKRNAVTDEHESKRTRRPTAIMRQNVEFARLMGMPGTKQKHMSVSDLVEDKPAPQHLSGSRNRERETKPQLPQSRELRPQLSQPREPKPQAPKTPVAKAQPASKPQPVVNKPQPTPSKPLPTPSKPSAIATPTSKPSTAATPTSKPSSATTPTSKPLGSGGNGMVGAVVANSNSGSNGGSGISGVCGNAAAGTAAGIHAGAATAPRVRKAEASNATPRPTINGHLQHRPLPVVAHVPQSLSEPPVIINESTLWSVLDPKAALPPQAAGLPVRCVTGVLLSRELGKRKRRPPQWMKNQDIWGDDDGDDGNDFGSGRRKRPVAIPAVSASISDAKSNRESCCGGSDSRTPSICVCGVMPSSASGRARNSLSATALMPPPLVTPTSSERSPRVRPCPQRNSDSSSSQRTTPKDKEESKDDFQIYFGDLPSPRMIEVVRPKEVLLPSWRFVSPKAGGPALAAANVATATAEHAAGETGESSSDEDSEDATSDITYERRHTRTLERAIAAARAVARKMAQEERQRRQAAHQASTDATSDSPKGDNIEADEWRFRPSELAALCAAADMSFFTEGGSGASETAAPGATAGFFGHGGANRGADTIEAAPREEPGSTGSCGGSGCSDSKGGGGDVVEPVEAADEGDVAGSGRNDNDNDNVVAESSHQPGEYSDCSEMSAAGEGSGEGSDSGVCEVSGHGSGDTSGHGSANTSDDGESNGFDGLVDEPGAARTSDSIFPCDSCAGQSSSSAC